MNDPETALSHCGLSYSSVGFGPDNSTICQGTQEELCPPVPRVIGLLTLIEFQSPSSPVAVLLCPGICQKAHLSVLLEKTLVQQQIVKWLCNCSLSLPSCSPGVDQPTQGPNGRHGCSCFRRRPANLDLTADLKAAL